MRLLRTLLLAVSTTFFSASTVQAFEARERQLFVIDCAGTVARVDFSAKTVSVSAFDQRGTGRGRDGCVFDSIVSAGSLGTLAIVDEGPVDDGRRYSLARIDPATARIGERFTIPDNAEKSPKLVADPMSNRIYLLRNAEKIQLWVNADGKFETSGPWLPYFDAVSANPYLSPNHDYIVDGNRLLDPVASAW